jgi:acetyl esterase/lipase
MKNDRQRVASLVALVGALVLTVACVEGAKPDDEPASWLAHQDITYSHELTLDVYRPDAATPTQTSPMVLQLHGCCGDRTNLSKLAEAMAAAGATVLNVDWPGIDADARYPDAFEAVACAVRFARARATEYGADPRRLALLGWSDGALAAAVVTLHGDAYSVQRCVVKVGSAVPDLLVGVAGFYGWQLPVPNDYVTERAVRFMGGTPLEAEQAWHDATPYSWINEGPHVPALLLVSLEDPVRYDALAFAAALHGAGRLVRSVSVEHGGDTSMLSPRTLEGRTTVAETIGALRELPSLSADWPGQVIVTRSERPLGKR